MKQLYLASQSASRKQILTEAGIPFKLISHNCDEEAVALNDNFEDYVMSIATGKNESIISETIEKTVGTAYIVTADTLIQSTITGEILAKPRDKNHAYEMLRTISQGPIIVTTGMVVRRLDRDEYNELYESGRANVVLSIPCEFYIPEERMDDYLDHSPFALQASGACTVEGFGHQFMKSMNGSFTGAQGLPAFELREALEELGYYDE